MGVSSFYHHISPISLIFWLVGDKSEIHLEVRGRWFCVRYPAVISRDLSGTHYTPTMGSVYEFCCCIGGKTYRISGTGEAVCFRCPRPGVIGLGLLVVDRGKLATIG